MYTNVATSPRPARPIGDKTVSRILSICDDMYTSSPCSAAFLYLDRCIDRPRSARLYGCTVGVTSYIWSTYYYRFDVIPSTLAAMTSASCIMIMYLGPLVVVASDCLVNEVFIIAHNLVDTCTYSSHMSLCWCMQEGNVDQPPYSRWFKSTQTPILFFDLIEVL